MIRLELEEFKDLGLRSSKFGEYFFVHYNVIKSKWFGVLDDRYEMAEKDDERSYCCPELKLRWYLFDVRKPDDGKGFRDKKPALCLLVTDFDEDDCSGWTNQYKVEYCPFCGAEIVLQKVKVFEEYCEKEIEQVERCRVKRRQLE